MVFYLIYRVRRSRLKVGFKLFFFYKYIMPLSRLQRITVRNGLESLHALIAKTPGAFFFFNDIAVHENNTEVEEVSDKLHRTNSRCPIMNEKFQVIGERLISGEHYKNPDGTMHSIRKVTLLLPTGSLTYTHSYFNDSYHPTEPYSLGTPHGTGTLCEDYRLFDLVKPIVNNNSNNKGGGTNGSFVLPF